MFNLSGITNLIDKPLEGLSSYFTSKANSLVSGFTRTYSLSSTEKITLISDIYINRCYQIGSSYNAEAPSHNLDDGSVIAETLINGQDEWSMKCKLTSQNHKEQFEKLLKYKESGELVSLTFGGKTITNLAIMNIDRTIDNILYTDFTVSFKKLKFVKVAMIPAPEMKKVTSKPSESLAGKKETTKIMKSKASSVEIGIGEGKLTPNERVNSNPFNMINPFPFGVSGNILEKNYGINSILSGGK